MDHIIKQWGLTKIYEKKKRDFKNHHLYILQQEIASIYFNHTAFMLRK